LRSGSVFRTSQVTKLVLQQAELLCGEWGSIVFTAPERNLLCTWDSGLRPLPGPAA